MIIGTTINIVTAPLLGIIGDRAPSKVLIPISFALKGFGGYFFMFIQDPDSFWTLLLINIVGFCSGLETVAINVLFYRNLPS